MLNILSTFMYYCPLWMMIALPVIGILMLTQIPPLKIKTIKKYYNFEKFIFIISIIVISFITVFSRHAKRHDLSLIPFSFIIKAFKHPKILKSVFLNLVLFMPFGSSFKTMELIKGNKSNKKIIIYSAVFSLLIETFQLVYQLGSAEIDDVIINTLGGYAGCFLSEIAYKNFKNRLEKKHEQC